MEKKVAFYLRCSTSKQDLVSQRNAVEAWAKEQGHTVFDTYEDLAQSGFKRDREQVKRLMEDAVAGKFEAVGVLEVSRLGRSIKQIYEVIEHLVEHGVDIYLTKSNTKLDYHSLEGRALLGGLALAAEIEGILIRERNARGRQRIKDEGIKVGRKLAPVSLEAVQALRAQGKSYRQIAEALHTSPATVMRRIVGQTSKGLPVPEAPPENAPTVEGKPGA